MHQKRKHEIHSHEENQSRICLLCLSAKKEMRKISANVKLKIKSILQNINLNDERIPCVLCSTCNRKILCSDKVAIPDLTKFLSRTVQTKSVKTKMNEGDECDCYLCNFVRTKYLQKFKGSEFYVL